MIIYINKYMYMKGKIIFHFFFFLTILLRRKIDKTAAEI